MAGEPASTWRGGWFTAVTVTGAACVTAAWYLSQMPTPPPGWVIRWFGWLRPFLARDFASSLLVEIGVSLALAGVLLVLERKMRVYLAELVRVAFVTTSRDIRDLLDDLPRNGATAPTPENALVSVGDMIIRCGLFQVPAPEPESESDDTPDAPNVCYAFSSSTRPEVRWELLRYPDGLLAHRLTVDAVEVRASEPLEPGDFVALTRDLTQDLLDRLRLRAPPGSPSRP